ncbi:MAG: hypothetical protein NTZ50_00965 [Chloroflexi bacterium]|nr:hypothetical protein [Chloroflexota bacterium]
MRSRAYLLTAAVLFVGVLCLYLYVHPRIDTVGFHIGAVMVGAITILIYAYDPTGFSPLHTFNKISSKTFK